MLCKNCGKEAISGTLLCPNCGAKLEADFVKPGFEQIKDGNIDPIPESMRYENMNSQVNDNAWSGESFENRGYTQSEYSLADMPEKKVKRKRPLWLAIICSMFTFVLSIVLFAFCLTLLYVSVITSSISGVINTFSSKASSYSEVPVGDILNKFDGSNEYDSDVTLSEYIYDKLPASDKLNTTEEDIAEMIDNPSISEFVNGVMDDYIGVMTGELDEASVTNESIIQVVKDNEELVETTIGRELSDDDYDKIDSRLNSVNFENNTKITSSSAEEISGGIKSVLNLVRSGINSKGVIFASLGIAIGIVLLLILILNLHKPYLVFWHAGVCATISAAIGFATSAVVNGVVNELDSSERTYALMMMRLLGNPQDKMSSYSAIFLTVGIVLIVVYAVIAISRKILSKRV